MNTITSALTSIEFSQDELKTPIKLSQKPANSFSTPLNAIKASETEKDIDVLTNSFASIIMIDSKSCGAICTHKTQEYGTCVICMSPFKSPSTFRTTKCNVSSSRLNYVT
jgi:hypothetical protein